jgi:hypothetical protein
LVFAAAFIGEYPFKTGLPFPSVRTTILPRPLTGVEREVFFDCQEPLSRCRFFSVADFFHNVSNQFTSEEWMRLGIANPNLPAITTLEWWYEDEYLSSTTERIQDWPDPNLPPSVSFIHVHKCGGSTIHSVLRQVRDKIHNDRGSLHAQVSTFKYAIGPTNQKDKEVNAKLRWDHIQSMKLVFSIIRDPVERFFSGLQQIMHYHDDFRIQCLRRTSRATIQCALNFLQEPSRRPFLGDVHLLPMAVHFRLLDEHRVAVFDDVALVSRYFLNGTVWHERDRSNLHTATSNILATMGPRDCTPEMMKQICDLYEIDLLLRQSLGWEASRWCSRA